MLDALGYASGVWILTTYAVLSRTGRARPFHLANALGCVPVLITEAIGGVGPAMLLTGAFGALGWFGLWSTRRKAMTLAVSNAALFPDEGTVAIYRIASKTADTITVE